MKQRFSVTGMTCSACSAHVHSAVCKLSGVESADVNVMTGSMTVNFNEAEVTQADIIQAVQAAGYGAAPANEKAKTNVLPAKAEELPRMKRRLWISFGFLVPLMYVSMGHMVGLPLPPFFTYS